MLKFVKPKADASFTITSVPEWPSIVFETDQKGAAHTWTWTLTWGTFSKTGKATTLDNSWDAKSVVENCGGTLSVRADANKVHGSINVKIGGTNPSSAEVTTYLNSKANATGFDKIIAQESRYRHFNKQNQPIKSFDNGYGMCQLTDPKPTFEQVWNWKQNVDGGLKLFESKRLTAIKYLSQSGRGYTPDQLTSETVCRWNGGNYHEWDATNSKWVRHANILCDSKTGNIGWNMDDAENKGKTEDQLHKRDSAGYNKHTSASHWNYYGVCYADHILGTPAATPATTPTAGADSTKGANAGSTLSPGQTNLPGNPTKNGPLPSSKPLPMPPLPHPEAHPNAPFMDTSGPTKLG